MGHNLRIGVLMGGVSSEREVSLKSGHAVSSALKSRGLEAVEIDIQHAEKNYVKDLLLSYDLGLAFVAMHGSFGEDGKLQAILEEISLPYTGSAPAASALAMDKIASKKKFQDAGLFAPRYFILDRNHKGFKNSLGFPLVVKPVCGGSSLGLAIVDNIQELKLAIDAAFQYDRKIIIEEYLRAREMTVGILEDCALEAIEIKPKRRFFDYQAKYESGQTEYIVPADVSQNTMQLLKDTALKAHSALGCSFFSRVDIILSDEAKPYVLEVNTIPGFTTTSLLPKAALHKGISFAELILKISQAALSVRHKDKPLIGSLLEARQGASKERFETVPY